MNILLTKVASTTTFGWILERVSCKQDNNNFVKFWTMISYQ